MLNRSARRATLFEDASDYDAFADVLASAVLRANLRVLSYCIMPNHWHLVVWPESEAQLPSFMRWLTLTHAARWLTARGLRGLGPVYQNRYKALPIQSESHVATVIRYVERNPLRARLVSRAEEWRWSSLWARCNACYPVRLATMHYLRAETWVEFVNQPQTTAELEAMQLCIRRNRPIGDVSWQREAAERFGLEASLKEPGRPRRA